MSKRNLIDDLPKVRGHYEPYSKLSSKTWFRVGGPAEVLYIPADIKDLLDFLHNIKNDIPITILGMGSNLLVRDGGIPGVTIKLGKAFSAIEIKEDNIICGASVSCPEVARKAELNSISGLEFLTGIPGSIGGAIRMNAGSYGQEMKEVLISFDVIDLYGKIKSLKVDDLSFQYRKSNTPDGWIFINANIKGRYLDRTLIREKMKRVRSSRSTSQPIKNRTSGSTFTNPLNFKAWELIDQAGCRGLNFGNASVSNQHCNFLINNGNASAEEIELLGEEVRERVYKKFGVKLRWEIIRVGVNASHQDSLLKLKET